MGKPFASQDFRLHLPYVRVLIALHGLSQRELARLARVHEATVSRVLKNSRRVTPEKRRAVLLALARRVGRDPEELCRLREAEGRALRRELERSRQTQTPALPLGRAAA